MRTWTIGPRTKLISILLISVVINSVLGQLDNQTLESAFNLEPIESSEVSSAHDNGTAPEEIQEEQVKDEVESELEDLVEKLPDKPNFAENSNPGSSPPAPEPTNHHHPDPEINQESNISVSRVLGEEMSAKYVNYGELSVINGRVQSNICVNCW